MSEVPWRDRLRSPTGQGQLMGACLLGAALLGVLVASQPGFFRGKQGLELKALSGFDESARRELRAVLKDGAEPGDLAARLVASAPDAFSDLLLRALIAGDPAQRQRALRLAQQVPDASRAALVAVSEHADRTADQELRGLLDGSPAWTDIVHGIEGDTRPVGGVGDE